MRRIMTATVLLASLLSAAAFADTTVNNNYNSRNQPGTTGDTGTTQATTAGMGLRGEKVSIRPQVGVLAYKDATNSTTSRLAAGLTVDFNLMPFLYGFSPDQQTTSTMSDFYLGAATGAIYSHLGDASSNFVGTSATTPSGQAGANFLLIPADLKLGYNFTDMFRVSVHGGGNVIYQSAAGSILLSPSISPADTSSRWAIYPNVGANLDFGPLTIRPDWTITTRNYVFTGTVGYIIPLA